MTPHVRESTVVTTDDDSAVTGTTRHAVTHSTRDDDATTARSDAQHAWPTLARGAEPRAARGRASRHCRRLRTAVKLPSAASSSSTNTGRAVVLSCADEFCWAGAGGPVGGRRSRAMNKPDDTDDAACVPNVHRQARRWELTESATRRSPARVPELDRRSCAWCARQSAVGTEYSERALARPRPVRAAACRAGWWARAAGS